MNAGFFVPKKIYTSVVDMYTIVVYRYSHAQQREIVMDIGQEKANGTGGGADGGCSMSEILEIEQRIEVLKNHRHFREENYKQEMQAIDNDLADAGRALIKAREREQQAQMVARRVVA